MKFWEKGYFETRFWQSFIKVGILVVFTFLPLIINIAIAVIPPGKRTQALEGKIIPGEIIAYCLGFIAPLFVMILKTHGKGFKIPALKFAFVAAFVIWALALVLVLVAKNHLVTGIDLQAAHWDLYFWLTVICLISAISLRLYTDFQDSRFSDFKQNKDDDQAKFNNNFINTIPST